MAQPKKVNYSMAIRRRWKAVHKRRASGESSQSIADDLGISKALVSLYCYKWDEVLDLHNKVKDGKCHPHWVPYVNQLIRAGLLRRLVVAE